MPTEIRLHQRSRVLEIALYDLGSRQESLWKDYLSRLAAAGASS